MHVKIDAKRFYFAYILAMSAIRFHIAVLSFMKQ